MNPTYVEINTSKVQFYLSSPHLFYTIADEGDSINSAPTS